MSEIRRFTINSMHTWQKIEKKYGLPTRNAHDERALPSFEYFMLGRFDFDIQYDMSKMYG
jgi:hypothetical protein